MYYYRFSDGLIFMQLANWLVEQFDLINTGLNSKEKNKLYLGLKSDKHNLYKGNNPIVLAELGIISVNYFCDRDRILLNFFLEKISKENKNLVGREQVIK